MSLPSLFFLLPEPLRHCLGPAIERGLMSQILRNLWTHRDCARNSLCLASLQPPEGVDVYRKENLVIWAHDSDVLVGMSEGEKIHFYPWPMRARLHHPRALLRALDVHLFQEALAHLPPLARDWEDVHKGAFIPGWMPFHGGWAHAPLPDWARDRTGLESAFTGLALARLRAIDWPDERFHCSLSGAGFCAHGEFIAPEISKGSAFFRARPNQAVSAKIQNAAQILAQSIQKGISPAWFVDTYIDVHKTTITRGTLLRFSTTQPQPIPSAHIIMSWRARLPHEVLDAIDAIHP